MDFRSNEERAVDERTTLGDLPYEVIQLMSMEISYIGTGVISFLPFSTAPVDSECHTCVASV